MIVEVDDIFLKDKKEKEIIEINISEPRKIEDILMEIGFKDFSYASYFLNDKKVDLDELANNDDRLVVLPIFGGG